MANRTLDTTPQVPQAFPTAVTCRPPSTVPTMTAGLGRGAARDTAVWQRATDGRLYRAGNALWQLQRSHGNRHVQRLVVQAKMLLGPVSDPYEQEADQVARRVAQGQPHLVQRRVAGEGGTAVPSEVASAIHHARGSGRPLPAGLQQQMSQAFNTDFSGVRVHTDAQADGLNRSLQARAFTTGQHIFFRRGEYSPGSMQGQHILAHELTHVVQQAAPTMGSDPASQMDFMQRLTTPNKPETTTLTEEALKEREKEAPRDLKGEKIWAEAIFSGGKMYKKTGSIDGRRAEAKLVDGKVIFVYSTEGQIYVRSEPHGVPRPDEFTHANFLSGAPIKTSGQMFVRSGQITRLDNESGHYMPEGPTLEWVLQKLEAEQVDLSKTLLVMNTKAGYKTYNARDYIDSKDPKEIDDSVRREDEDYQKQYDAHIGIDTVQFDYFGWPYGKLRGYEWKPKIKLIKQRLLKGAMTSLEIVYKSGDKEKGQGNAKAVIAQLLKEVNASQVGPADVRPMGSQKKYIMEITVAAR